MSAAETTNGSQDKAWGTRQRTAPRGWSQSPLVRRWLQRTVATVVCCAALAASGDESLANLRVGSTMYSNVTVLSKTRNDVFIKHDGGLTNLKVRDLDTEVAGLLGYQVAAPKPSRSQAVAQKLQADPRIKEMQAMIASQVATSLKKADAKILWGLLAGVVLSYLFFCYCCMLICQKSGTEPGVLVWLPIVQAFPMLKAAGMPSWWFLWFLLPVLNLVASVVWCVKIAQARKKTIVTAIMLMLPVTSFLAFFYLAFSDAGGETAEAKPITLG